MTYTHILQDFLHKLTPLSAAQSVKGASSSVKQALGRAIECLRQPFSNDMVVDLGTSNTIIYVPDHGIVLNEPSIIAFNDANEIIAIGRDAKMALGRQASTVRIVRPLNGGVIADFDAAQMMLSYFIKSALAQRKFSNPRVLICAPGEVTPVERRALEDAAGRAGARYVDVIEEPIAAAVGAGFDIQSGGVFMIVDIGGGTSDIAVLGYGGPVHLSTVRAAGCKMDEAIARHIRLNHCIEIGELTAEAIKLELGSAGGNNQDRDIEVRGRSLETELPAVITITREEVRDAVGQVVEEIIQGVRHALEELSPEVSAGLLESGIVLTGGASQLPGLAERISRETGLEARLASDVESVAALGAGRLFKDGGYITIRELMAHRSAKKPQNRNINDSYSMDRAA